MTWTPPPTKAVLYEPIGELVTSWAQIERRVGYLLAILKRSEEWRGDAEKTGRQITRRLKFIHRVLQDTQRDRPQSLNNVTVAFTAIWRAKRVRDDVVHGYLNDSFPHQAHLSIFDPAGAEKATSKYLTIQQIKAATHDCDLVNPILLSFEHDLRYVLFVTTGVNEHQG